MHKGQSIVSRVSWIAPRIAVVLMLMIMVVAAGRPARALEGAIGIHDPSSIIKIGGTYHMWGTGQGILHLTSTDLVNWSTSSSVFSGNGPAWIQTYVSGFTGFFWAPEIVSMGGKYYLYYACSLGARPCAIGCATSSDGYNWTDQGMVVYSNNSTTYGSIDPSVFQDASGNYWMTWGSHLTGIWDAQLNASTGKLLNSSKYNIANFSDAEASKVIPHGGAYYVFYNRGVCCNGVNSTYYISYARATSPAGPYTGNTTFIAGASPQYGPGQLGYIDDGGTEYISYHYYDGNNNGAPTLGLAHLTWNGNTPVNNPGWISNGTYKITNAGNGLAWDDWGCAGTNGQAIAQNTYSGINCQRWVFTNQGWDSYKITCLTGGRSAEVLNCNGSNGGLMDIYDDWGGSCQRWHVNRASNGTYVFQSFNGNRVVDVPNGTSQTGKQLDIWDSNGLWTQQWNVSAP